MVQFYPLTVSDITPLTPNAVDISFEIPESLKEAFAFEAGQYITLKHPAGDTEIRRAYSLSSKPGENKITIGVKKVPGGTFSVYANQELKKGDVLEVMPPQGRFVFTADRAPRKIVAFAAGSGITPIMSIVQTALESNTENKVILVYGNKSREEAMYFDSLQNLKEKYNDRFFVYYLFSRNQEEESMFGRIDKSKVNYITQNVHKSMIPDTFYLCGPLPMIETVTAALKENGVSENNIQRELFTTPDSEAPKDAETSGKTHLEITLDDAVHTLEIDRKNLVLDALIKAKIDAPFSCQGGVCSTCIARVTEGKASMVKNQILTESELAEGFILTCQAHAESAVLKIDYDDI
ncbi:MAG: ferredoxin--NADP reductase [Robiginitalea sp.]|uniref:2Fe-2S iron-sulfur cluster-binding protein n=1 Tax=Robiginitalea sp. TaxID=1902411 RepID=UPI003C70BFB8